MAAATRGTASNYLQRAPSPSGLADVLDVILDKGLVIDAYVRVSVIGIEVLTIDALRGSGAKEKTKGAIEGAKEKGEGAYEQLKEKVEARR